MKTKSNLTVTRATAAESAAINRADAKEKAAVSEARAILQSWAQDLRAQAERAAGGPEAGLVSMAASYAEQMVHCSDPVTMVKEFQKHQAAIAKRKAKRNKQA